MSPTTVTNMTLFTPKIECFVKLSQLLYVNNNVNNKYKEYI